MNKQWKIMLAPVRSKSLRKMMHELCNHPKQRIMQLKEIPKPAKDPNNPNLPYTGP